MKRLERRSEPPDERRCAAELLELIPQMMQRIRVEMRSGRGEISVPQFRALAFIHNHEAASLSAVAEHIGLSAPSMSKLIDNLVARGLVERGAAADDRRRLTLRLTAQGGAALALSRRVTRARLAEALAPLSGGELAEILRAVEILRPLFGAAVVEERAALGRPSPRG
jgi:MarR family transcriptional regulator for hemolysin